MQKSERREKFERPPALYDLTTLQRDANRMLGYSAQQTLDYTQALYEKKLVTYPRTDSRYLTEDMAAGLPGLVMDTAVAFGFRGAVPVHAKQVIHNQKVSTTPFCRHRAWPGLTFLLCLLARPVFST